MPLVTPPAPVSAYLAAHGYDTNPNLLIIAENYPNVFGVRPWGYFYRTLFPFPIAGAKPFFDFICDRFGIALGTEPNMLNDFLNGAGIGNGRRLLIDALPDGVPPVYPIAAARLNDLVNDINFINPNYIMIIHNRMSHLIPSLFHHPRFITNIPKLVINPLYTVNPLIFPYPAPPANPNNFLDAINAARRGGYPI